MLKTTPMKISIIHDATITNIYLQEFEKRWGELSGSNVSINNNISNLDIYPNPSTGQKFTDKVIKDIYIYNVEGKLLKKQSSKIILLIHSGTYFLKIVFSDQVAQ